MSDTKVLTPDGTQHLIDKIKSEKESTFRFSTMPTPSVDYADGKPYQYIGATTSVAPIYTNGYFYKCVAQGTEPETYAWENVDVQDGGSGGDSRIGEEVTKIGVKFDNGWRPYISFSPTTIIPSFADASWKDIIDIADMYYAGDISLSDIKSVWSVEDEKTFELPAIEATGNCEAQPAQTVTMVISDFNHNDLTTASGNIEKSLLSLTSKYLLDESGVMGANNYDGCYWETGYRRPWLNGAFFNAIPSSISNGIKSVSRNYHNTSPVDDKVYMLVSYEILGQVVRIGDSSNSQIGTQFKYFENSANRYRAKRDGTTADNWTSEYFSSYGNPNIVKITNGGGCGINVASWLNGISFNFDI